MPTPTSPPSTAPDGRAAARPPGTAWSTLAAYVALTKPRIIELLLVTTIPTMLLAQRGFPPVGLVLATLVGGTAAAGAANALNQYLDRDIDKVMHRTKRRPLVTGEVSPRGALVFGLVLAAASLVWFAVLVNPLATVLTAVAIVAYVVGYTLVLKRRTPQNIVWGGAAGCMPVLIGWAAVTGSLDWPPVALFAVVFFWTPPHYWPLSMKFRRDYAAAGVPMLPVVASDVRVAWEILAYSVGMVAASLALVPLASMSWLYTLAAALSGAWFLWITLDVLRRARAVPPRPLKEMRLFHGSITYLTILFAAVAIDPVLM